MSQSLKYTEQEFDLLIKNIKSKKSAIPDSPTDTPDKASAKKTKPLKKRQGVSAEPIINALTNAKYAIEVSPNSITIAFDGARLFSLNELFALLQYRPYIVFQYKKLLKLKVLQALQSIPKETLPYFNSPCHLTFFRSGSKLIDLDNFSPMFKVLLDMLKHDKTKNPLGVIADDNPNIFFSETKVQTIGRHKIALKIERIMNPASIITTTPVETLFSKEILWH